VEAAPACSCIHYFVLLAAATMLLLLLIPIQSQFDVSSTWDSQTNGFLACGGKKGLWWIAVIDLSSI
jgi:hypothetical protein